MTLTLIPFNMIIYSLWPLGNPWVLSCDPGCPILPGTFDSRSHPSPPFAKSCLARIWFVAGLQG